MKFGGADLPVFLLLTGGLVVILLVASGSRGSNILILGPDNTDGIPDSGSAQGGSSNGQVNNRSGLPPATVPVGSVVAWLKSYTNTPALPAQWVECNGQTLSMPGSPYDKLTIPDLNGVSGQEQRFLRGAAYSGATGGAETHNHGNFLVDRSGKRVVNISANNQGSNLPPYYEVTWILKVL